MASWSLNPVSGVKKVGSAVGDAAGSVGDALFGSGEKSSTTMVSPLDYKYINQQRERQDELWPQLQKLAADTGAQSDAAYQAALQSLGIGEQAGAILAAGPVEAEKMYPGITEKLTKITDDLGKLYNKNSEVALSARTGELGKAYSGVLDRLGGMADKAQGAYDQAASDVKSFGLDPQGEAFLKSLKDERINMLKSDLDSLIGSKIADLGSRGVLSSSTSADAMGAVAKSALPAISQINADYATQRINLPQQLAALSAQITGQGNADVMSLLANKYNMGKDYGQTVGGAYDLNTTGAQSNADYLSKLMQQQFGNAGWMDTTRMGGASSIYGTQPAYATTISNLSGANINNQLAPYYQLWNMTSPASGTIGSQTVGQDPTTGIIPALAPIAGGAIGGYLAGQTKKPDATVNNGGVVGKT